VAEDHQTKNAMALVNHHAAVLVKDAEANEKLDETLQHVFDDNELYANLKSNIAKLGLTNATNAIVGVIEQLVK
jgi:UDP-N-acetylglucosamine--N-acetylmuramyl-(pentapeptide) pyrophosphoryl-undecaprenol N-acetylglucosamine transferase